ncbi:MAG: AarF/ABC1/UbiB kinase family protein [Myxococcota bacterium]
MRWRRKAETPELTGRTLALPEGPRTVKKAVRTRSFTPPVPKPAQVLVRVMAWSWVLVRFLVVRWLVLRRSVSDAEERGALRIAAMIGSMGGAAAYFGKRAGMRLDLLPREYALALSRLEDPAPPLAVEIVVDRIEGALGVPLSEAFEVFDPVPIASRTVDCVYQGILRNGDKVAVRVLRPGAIALVNTELQALRWVVGLLKHVVPDKNVLIQRVQDELPQLMLQGVDFMRRARLQRVMQKEFKRWRFRKVGIAKVYLKLCNENVILSEFVQGVWLHEVIGAVEHEDEAALEHLAKLKIDPNRCARRLLRFSWWATLETYVLLSAPHPSQLVVRPGGKIIMVDVAAALTMSRHQRRLLMTALYSFMQHDVETASDLLIELVSPLPPIDAYELSSRVRGALWAQLVAVERRDSPWWERSPTSIWLALFEVLREFGVDVSMELALAAQAQCVLGQLAFRMKPRMRLIPEFRRYRNRHIIRGAKLLSRELGNPRKDGGSRFVARPSEILGLQERGLLSLESSLEDAPLTYLELTHKGAFSFAELLRMLTLTVQLAVLVLIVKGVRAWWQDSSFDLVAELGQMLAEPLFIVVLVFLGILGIRRILFRLDDVDRDDD